jgi:hypothetical protein
MREYRGIKEDTRNAARKLAPHYQDRYKMPVGDAQQQGFGNMIQGA